MNFRLIFRFLFADRSASTNEKPAAPLFCHAEHVARGVALLEKIADLKAHALKRPASWMERESEPCVLAAHENAQP